MTDQEKQQLKEDRKADRALINEIRAVRRKIAKEQEGMTVREKTLYTNNSVNNFLRENGYTLKLADGTIIP
jgi:hypothetical protein